MLRLPIPDQARQLALVGLLDRLRDIAHRTQLSAGAECFTATSQHDHPYGRVLLGSVQSRVEGSGDVSAPGVESVGPVERHDRDTGRSDLVDHRLVLARVGDEIVSGAHLRDSSSSLRSASSPARLIDRPPLSSGGNSRAARTHTVYLSVLHSATVETGLSTPREQPKFGPAPPAR